eukprot:COSAG01_NODE_1311_length_10774_cov_18.218299_8_plen_172_part_00
MCTFVHVAPHHLLQYVGTTLRRARQRHAGLRPVGLSSSGDKAAWSPLAMPKPSRLPATAAKILRQLLRVSAQLEGEGADDEQPVQRRRHDGRDFQRRRAHAVVERPRAPPEEVDGALVVRARRHPHLGAGEREEVPLDASLHIHGELGQQHVQNGRTTVRQRVEVAARAQG